MLLLWISVIVWFEFTSTLNEGCILLTKYGQETGECKPYLDCPFAATQGLNNGKSTICGIDEDRVHVCCPKQQTYQLHYQQSSLRYNPHQYYSQQNYPPRSYPQQYDRFYYFQHYFNYNFPNNLQHKFQYPQHYYHHQQQQQLPHQYCTKSHSQENKPIPKTEEPVKVNDTNELKTWIESPPPPLSIRKCREYHKIAETSDDSIDAEENNMPSLIKKFPHAGILGHNDEDDMEWSCSGALISHTFFLTAAHCLNSSRLGTPKWVRLGDQDIHNDTDVADPQDFAIKRLIPHPDYKPPARYHDIALIELDMPVNFTAFVSPVCLSLTDEIDLSQAVATEYEDIFNELLGDFSTHLIKIDMQVIDNNKCNESYQSLTLFELARGIVEKEQICADVKEELKCQGDSGGPLLVKNNELSSTVNAYTAIGVTSYGAGCGTYYPSVYMRVSYYLPWIQSVVWPNEK